MRRIFKIQSDDGLIAQFSTRVLAMTMAFLIITPFFPLNETHGYFIPDDALDVVAFTDRDAEAAIADVMTEDGFLLKPALASAESDRSSFNDIFAYSVKPGDTLSSVAAQFGLKKETLMQENNIWNPNRLRAGMVLNILPVDGLSHLVKKGDTVEKIAKKYKVETETLVKQNQLEEGGELLADIRLIIPGAKRTAPVYSSGRAAPSSVAGYNYAGPKTGRLLWPTQRGASITQGFRRGHYALDISNRSKGPIFAAAGGKVIKSAYGWNGGFGNHVIIDHGNGMQTLYAHNEKLYVSAGQYVEAGQTVAWMGRSGRVYGPTGIHLHFEVRINGVKYNPMQFF